MAKGVLKIFGTKISYFTMLYKLTEMNVLFYRSLGMTEILSVRLSNQYKSFLQTEFHIFMVAELLLLNQEISYVMFDFNF